MEKRLRWFSITGINLLAAGGLLWGWLSWPAAVEVRRVNLPGGTAVLSAPRQVWNNSRADVQLAFTPAQATSNGAILIAKLEMPNVRMVNPAEIEAVPNNTETVHFRWQFTVDSPGVRNGTLWLHQKTAGPDENQSELLLAAPVEIEVGDVAGIGAAGARRLALAAAGAGLALLVIGRKKRAGL